MHITIHRGIDQIGGCITEIESNNGTKILIDLGHNLPDGDQPSYDPLDKPENLDDLLEGVSAVFYTHPHGDHLGFETRIVEKGITQYIGEISKEMMLTLKMMQSRVLRHTRPMFQYGLRIRMVIMTLRLLHIMSVILLPMHICL